MSFLKNYFTNDKASLITGIQVFIIYLIMPMLVFLIAKGVLFKTSFQNIENILYLLITMWKFTAYYLLIPGLSLFIAIAFSAKDIRSERFIDILGSIFPKGILSLALLGIPLLILEISLNSCSGEGCIFYISGLMLIIFITVISSVFTFFMFPAYIYLIRKKPIVNKIVMILMVLGILFCAAVSIFKILIN